MENDPGRLYKVSLDQKKETAKQKKAYAQMVNKVFKPTQSRKL